MSASDLKRWTARRWLATLGWVFAAHLLLILVLGERLRPSLAPNTFPTSLAWAVDAWTDQQVSQLPSVQDPASFALPALNGFSGQAWLRYPVASFEMADWSEPPRWLALSTQHLGNAFAEALNSSTPMPLLIADKRMPRRIASEGLVLPPKQATESALRLEGSLRDWELLTPESLPPWPYTDILGTTTLQLLVDEAGHVLSVTLLSSSGSAQADQAALKAAMGVRLTPPDQKRRTESVTVGKLIVDWTTVSPSNAPPSANGTVSLNKPGP